MNKTPLIFVLAVIVALVVIGCATQAQAQAQPTTAAPLAIFLPTMTPTATPPATATPAPDYVGTQTALLNIIGTQQAALAAQQVELAQIELARAELRTRETEAAALSEKAKADAERARADIAAQNAITADAQARAEQARAEQIAAQNQSVMANAQALRAETEAKGEQTRRVVSWVALGPLTLIGVGLIMLARRNAVIDAQAREIETDDQPEAPALTVKLDQRDAAGYGAVDLDATPPGSENAFTALVFAALSGAKGFSKPEWEGRESPYTRDTYATVYNWLWSQKFLTTLPGGKIILTADGEQYFRAWAENHYSPTDEFFSNIPQNPGENSQPPESQGYENDAEHGGEVV